MSAWLDAPLGTISIHDLGLAQERRDAASPASLRACVFLDKDGTLLAPEPSDTIAPLADAARLRLVPGAGEALARLQSAGLALVIVTNESGIARGAFTRAQFAHLQGALLRRLKDDFGVAIDDVAVCPHAPDAQGRPACLCRKPAPGMLVRAARAHGLDLARSWMVGDMLDDVEAGHRAGTGGLLLDTGAETAWRRSPLREPDAVFSDWTSLADHLLNLHATASRLAAHDAASAPSENAATGPRATTPRGAVPAVPHPPLPATPAPAQA
ncbi:hypothetical protein CDN99_07565 [Roseateles aquatilis]|uniref:D,D-heptose 1,7-bisphosphate phosphatase n=1 Tax=Roseateles aquatilis TaxID=431061 RepID=A0A246JIV7_9BURK|nr:hypothetical protein CDN99_07565 [Roseateles aquatilis]